jgi:hypothetical protein
MTTPKPHAGRPEYRPTQKKRRLVEILSAARVPQQAIAEIVGCDTKTLRKYFASEIEHGPERATGRLLERLADAAAEGNTNAAKFLLANVILPATPLAKAKRRRRPVALGKKQRLEQQAVEPPPPSSGWSKLVN